MKPYTTSTYGRNRYFYPPKEHRVPKSSSERRGTRTAMRQRQKGINNQLIVDAVDSVLE